MSTSLSTSVGAKGESIRQGHIGLVVLGSIASGLLLGLALVLLILMGGPEHEIIGAALLALGLGFVQLGIASSRLTNQPQTWALSAGTVVTIVGVALWALSPSEHALARSGWVWPVVLLGLVVGSVRGARRELRNWSRRAVLYPALLVLVLVAVGGAYETVIEATASNPPLGGRTYLVNGHRLYLDCVGHGSPTVLLFNGLGERTPSWAWVQQSVSSSTRVCTYDRAGEGWSSGSPGARDGHQLSSDLHGLLVAAHVAGPYVLAGHSVGGIYALLYAKDYPGQVAGVALIDSSTPYQFALPDYPSSYKLLQRLTSVLPSFARAGLVRLSGSSNFAGLPIRARNAAQAFAASPRELTADHAGVEQLPELFNDAKRLTSLGAKPLAVVTATVGDQRGWLAAQNRLAQLSVNSTHQSVPGATHESLLEDKRFARIVSREITHVIEAARS